MRKKGILLALIYMLLAGCTNGNGNGEGHSQPVTLKDAFKDKFLFGVAVNADQVSGKNEGAVKVIKQQFNSIVAENCMKSEELQPKEGEFFFDDADAFVKFGEENNMFIVGHALIWHSQAPEWFFVDEHGNDVSREVLIERMKSHINTIVGRYKGRVNGWDVVNEAIEDDGSYRNNKFHQIIGEDYIPLAFQLTHEADPDAELYYNDYSMAHKAKCQGVIKMVKLLQEKEIRIDGIGMQGHLLFDFPTPEGFEESLISFAETGVNVMITELDFSVLPSPRRDVGAEVSLSFEYQQEMNPYTDSLPDDVEKNWQEHYMQFFDLFLKHHDKISRVTMWGVGDGDSWKNDWPMEGRTDYPLLFDRNYNAKPIVEEIIKRVNE